MLALFLACAAPAPSNADKPDAATDTAADTAADTFAHRHYVASDVTVPTTLAAAAGFAFDLDGDGEADNALGGVTAMLADPANDGVQPVEPTTAAIAAGTLVYLHALGARDFSDDAAATWQVYVGTATEAPPAFDGTDTFSVDAAGPTDAVLQAVITSGRVNAGPGNLFVPIVLTPGAAPIRVPVAGAFLDADVDNYGCVSGRIGGGIAKPAVDTLVVPALASAFDAIVAASGAACRASATSGDTSACTADAASVLARFDSSPKDGEITAVELTNEAVTRTLLTPDVDLVAADEHYAPTVPTDAAWDAEAVSFAVGFTCSRASFDAPEE